MIRAAVLRAWCSHALRLAVGLALIAAGAGLLFENRVNPPALILGVSLGLVLVGGLIIDPARVLSLGKQAGTAARDFRSAFQAPPSSGDAG